jgi:glyoxylase-like metal-dependent hydrolase (beta-lactamase superfamily II)
MSFHVLGKKTGVFESAVCIGVLNLDHGFALIDSGVEESATKKAIQAIGDQFGPLRAIINTHAHADHIGGNAWLMRKEGVVSYAPASEQHFIEHPELEPHFLFGCEPVPELNNKFYRAKPSKVVVPLLPGVLEIDGHVLTFVDLKGHSPGMLGILSEDGIFHMGDALMPEHIVNKHKLMFFHDLGNHLNTIHSLKEIEAKGYILSHGGYVEQIHELIELNRQALLDVNTMVYELTRGGVQDADIHAELYERLGMVEGAAQYYLNHAVVRGHLKYLKQQNRIEMLWSEGRIIWKAL